MSSPRPARTPYRLTLYVVGTDNNSLLAQENLRHISAEYLIAGTCTITVVDVLEDYESALENNVFVTPTLLVDGPRGRTTIIGNLSDIDRIVLTIGADR